MTSNKIMKGMLGFYIALFLLYLFIKPVTGSLKTTSCTWISGANTVTTSPTAERPWPCARFPLR